MKIHYRIMMLAGALALLAGCGQDLLGPSRPFFYAAVTTGGEHSCALNNRGDAYCWGAGGDGQVGDGAVKSRVKPSRVDGSRMWRSISAGAAHTCAVSVDGEALCWGWNAFGQLGIGELVGLGTPGTVAGGHQWQSVSSGWHHACGITTAGESYCWGHNRQGQLGSGARTEREPAPVRVAGGIEFTALSGGAQHTCGLAADGTAYCWGLNQYGQLGAHAEPLTETPVVAWPHLKFAQVSAGVGHTCGITRQGTAYCWGKNEDGELGNGSIDPPGLYRVGEPVAIFGGFSLRSITAGNGVSCGVTTAGRGVCWGRGVYGQLGLGSTIGHATPQHVTRVKEFAEVSGSGMTHLCGLTTGNAIYCWGTGERGQLGAGGLTHTLEPVRVTEVR